MGTPRQCLETGKCHIVYPNSRAFISLFLSNFHWVFVSTPILLTWRIWWDPNNAGKWQMGFNSAFKGVIIPLSCLFLSCSLLITFLLKYFSLLYLFSFIISFSIFLSHCISPFLQFFSTFLPSSLLSFLPLFLHSHCPSVYSQALQTSIIFFKDLLHSKSVRYTGLQNYEIVPLTNLP